MTYEPGKDAWFSATCTLTAQGRLSSDYDREPAWRSLTAPGHDAEDVAQYPRDPEHTPDWLRQRLAEAGR